ncbi:MAG TPA: precorrin-6y C5,15-methyltransferase (decarboxylating) subunit CbiE [Euzebyales bacterium]|nr:precorrin-6y C5,15-methyltransferase (decarboxylating) subunit CbiE [Euzebyales bacterium]
MTTVTVLGLPRRHSDDDLTALARADVVAGGRRHLDATRHLWSPRAEEVALAGDLAPALERVAAAAAPVVLASGDPGFFGIVRALGERVGAEALDVRPAASAITLAFARAGLSWDDARIVSAHGRDPAPAVATCRRFPKVAVLTAPDFGPTDLARALDGVDRVLVVAERLGGDGERVVRGSPAEIAAQRWQDPNTVIVLDPRARPAGRSDAAPARVAPAAWALDEAAFSHRDGMITMAEVRAVALAWLGPGPGDLVWDVGAGSGSVAVEAARLGAAVIAVERDGGQCDLVRVNAERHAVPVQVVRGVAPEALTDLPAPDAVFVGGGGADVVAAAAAAARRTVVVALATVERVGPVIAALETAGLEVDGTQVAASRLAVLPAGHRLAAANPVFLLRGRRP